MRLERYDDPVGFLDAAASYLEAREVYHNLPLGVAHACAEDGSRYPGPNYFAVVRDAGEVRGVALMTPPHNMQVFVPAGAGADVLLADLAAGEVALPGAHGPEEATLQFARAWCAGNGATPHVRMRLRSFSLERVIPAPSTPGAMRPAVRGDLRLLAEWYDRFYEETGAGAGTEPPAEQAARAVRGGRAFVWQDGGMVVAQAVTAGATARGARIGGVYTPPERRRRGYATALVGALSQHLLDQGRSWCALYTDLANPTSNAIYPRVGYRPVGDFVDVAFTPGT